MIPPPPVLFLTQLDQALGLGWSIGIVGGALIGGLYLLVAWAWARWRATDVTPAAPPDPESLLLVHAQRSADDRERGMQPLLDFVEAATTAALRTMPVRPTGLERAATWVGFGRWAEGRRSRRETRQRSLQFRFTGVRRADPT